MCGGAGVPILLLKPIAWQTETIHPGRRTSGMVAGLTPLGAPVSDSQLRHLGPLFHLADAAGRREIYLHNSEL